MTLTQFLGLFPAVKETQKGWDVRCPAHDDRHPSLGILEGQDGRIVLNCFAGCKPESICEALGLALSDLFADKPLNGHAEPHRVLPVTPSPRKLAFAFELHALDLHLQADKILAAATTTHCEDCETWTDDEGELAMKAVARAYAYRERAQFCESYADHLRERDYELKRLALG